MKTNNATLDYIFGGSSTSPDIAARLLQCNFDVGALRPWIGSDGQSYVTLTQNGKPVNIRTNANTTLRKDEWKMLDTAVLRAAKNRLRCAADLRAAGLTFTIPNGMGKTVLEYERQSDINDATISMDGLRVGADDRPEYDIQYLPLPIIHKDFQFSARQIAASRNGSTPLDTTMAELAGRKVAEQVEKLVVGTASSFAYGGGTIYGYSNFTSRLTKTITSPASTGWAASTTLGEVLDMRKLSVDSYHYGPWVLYCGTAWDRYLDTDYSTNYPGQTLRERIAKIEGISSIRSSDYLTGYTMILVEMNPEVVRLVIGMEVTTLEWETHGGMLKNYKVMTIMVPQLRTDINSKTGIVHGSTA